jgi:hypothetical protein
MRQILLRTPEKTSIAGQRGLCARSGWYARRAFAGQRPRHCRRQGSHTLRTSLQAAVTTAPPSGAVKARTSRPGTGRKDFR